MSNINETMKLKDILFKVPAAAGIFREIDIDFVNHGEQTLKEAHEEVNFDLVNIVYEVNELGKERIEGIDVSYMDQISIIKYIERKYYEDLLDELPVLNDYVEKLGSKYKKEDAEYDKVAELFYNIYREMTVHIETEQSDVYPLLLTYYEHDSQVAFEALKPHITRLLDEHKNIVNWFKQIRSLTNGYTPVDSNEPLNVFVMKKLEENEENIMTLLHLENNLLFTPFR
ncbi:iron-sulfur cluster repair di-iron protein [Jeotgalicoccus coquinae]|uniref:Iron-sulfur cluster repair protein ScdA n=1 Tax=Jeotgalicoccus coquinae TaxID=709509 RepID=A0A6V7RMF5_9STAP|nr:hemerythrin domain-containing protein [Jeotgalicoccus coquinae]MBB6422162.1 regulator of cell morphogenesis and NO signaling [Jeotgalicoccus coquinae]GGE18153.1 iron-sulfur cluster repair di-iron protein [Jeotgalicoccus coquinae]CAD2079468.1 Iron-sulfur cluster repair protein ScdA [Jeotgalicoccus coquinae]